MGATINRLLQKQETFDTLMLDLGFLQYAHVTPVAYFAAVIISLSLQFQDTGDRVPGIWLRDADRQSDLLRVRVSRRKGPARLRHERVLLDQQVARQGGLSAAVRDPLPQRPHVLGRGPLRHQQAQQHQALGALLKTAHSCCSHLLCVKILQNFLHLLLS